MRLFDEKARLFGVINIIDFLVVVLVLVAAGGFYQMRYGGLGAAKPQTKAVEAVFLVQNVRMATVDVIKIGDQVRDSRTNNYLGEVVAIDVRPAEILSLQPDGRFVETTSPSRKDIYVTIRGPGTVSPNIIMLGSNEIRIGTRINLKTNLWAVETTVMAIRLE
jgi:hypothetical protein